MVEVYTIPPGDAGIKKTVRKMRELVREAITLPLPVETAALITSMYPCCGTERAHAIREFLVAHVVFNPDPVGHELLRTPMYLLKQIQRDGYTWGDCDDVATLGATLGMSAGLPARFVLLGFRPNAPFSHVFTELDTPQGWLELDTTAPTQFPEGLVIHKRKTVEV